MDINKMFIGSETQKALDNFPISGYTTDPYLIKALAMVKQAACNVNFKLGYLSEDCHKGISYACKKLIDGSANDCICVDPLQGGAGTSYNMNFNESIAMMANQFLCEQGICDSIDPLNQVNLHQSTNDVFPSAVKVAILLRLKDMEQGIANLQESLQNKEKAFANIPKLGRTELQDALPMTLGMEFGAYAEAISRDRWRIFKSRERIKTLNLGGTAIGTGLGAPRDYIFMIVEELKKLTGLSISRAENLVDATQNLDSIVEVSAICKAFAVNLLKIANDLKLLSSGPDGGYGEIKLPALQKGSTIMPAKVNPVMPEAVCQVALKVISDDNLIAMAAGLGQLELNQHLPLIAYTILEDLRLLTNIATLFATKCVSGITANEETCHRHLYQSKSIATYLLPIWGYQKVEEIVADAHSQNLSIDEYLIKQKLLTAEQLKELMSPKRMYKLGFSKDDYDIGDKS